MAPTVPRLVFLCRTTRTTKKKKKSAHAATKSGLKKMHLDSTPSESHANKKPRITRGPGDYFLYNKEGKMPFPLKLEKGKRVCLMHAKKGLTCSNPRCSMIHSPPNE
jgi:hypothetical protein